MNPLADLTQAPLLYKIGDKTYEVAPLNSEDLGAFCQYVQYQTYYSAKALPDFPLDRLQALLETCLNKTVSLGDSDFNKTIETPGGMAEWAYLSLRSKHNLTREDVRRFALGDLVNICKLASAISLPIHNDDQKKMAAAVVELLRHKP